MNRISIFFLVLLLACFTMANAYAAAKGRSTKNGNGKSLVQLQVGEVFIEGDLVSTDVTIVNGTSDMDMRVYRADKKELLNSSHQPVPRNLWILVDASTMCHTKGIDKYFPRLLLEIREEFHPDTIVSVVSYTKQTMELLSNHRPLRDVQIAALDCDTKSVSTSYDRPLQRLLKSKKHTGLPTVVWVFTAGNVQLSDETVASLQQRNVRIHLFLYHALVKNIIRASTREMQRKLGKDRFRFSILNDSDDEISFPEQWHRLTFTPAFEMRGQETAVEVVAGVDGKDSAQQVLMVSVPEGGSGYFFEKYGTLTLILVVLAGLAFGFYRIRRYYMPKFCPECERRMRTGDTICLPCRQETDAFLVGKFSYYDPKKRDHLDVVLLDRAVVELGTHRKSWVRVLRPPQRKRRCYARIVQEKLAGGKNAYRMEKWGSSADTPVHVNGCELKEYRYLAAGDKLCVESTEMTFLTGSKRIEERDSHVA